jgi:leucyl-tRNA synthetase
MQNKDIYQPENIEPKWAKTWEENKIYQTKVDKSKEKLHIMDMFPYPSGEGLHAGHAKVFGASDIYTRFKECRDTMYFTQQAGMLLVYRQSNMH